MRERFHLNVEFSGIKKMLLHRKGNKKNRKKFSAPIEALHAFRVIAKAGAKKLKREITAAPNHW
jgi:hypothetical protein